MFTRKSEIVFIGAGKVAHTLIPLLIENNYPVKGIVSRSRASASSLAKKYKLKFHSDNFSWIPSSCRIFFLTVPDKEISLVAKELSLLDLEFNNSLFVHTSGSENSAALKSAARKGGKTASFHIMQTFPSLKKTDIRNSYAAIETGSVIAEKYLFSLARNLNLNGFKLSKENKVYYHLAGVFAANFLNANFFSSERLLEKAGLGNKYFRLFEPIITATLLNIKNSGVGDSLSGPVQRGDYLTIKKHTAALKDLKIKGKELLLKSYISQSLVLLEVIKKHRKKLSPGQKELKRILEEELAVIQKGKFPKNK